MKIFKSVTCFLILFLLLLTIGAISASDNITIQDNALNSSKDCLSALEADNYDGAYGNAIIVEPDSDNPNEIINPTIQPAIDRAKAGDTIILNGDFYHCHFTVNKTVNIVATSQSTLGPCPHYQSEGAGSFGVFYITENGSGSSFKGITFSNSAKAEIPFDFLIRNASDITISDCTIEYPETDDNKFQGIIIENSNNIRLDNLTINNTIHGIRIINSSNIDITDCIISNNLNQAVSISGNSENITIKRNSIERNKNCAIKLESANSVDIENNLIKSNGLDMRNVVLESM